MTELYCTQSLCGSLKCVYATFSNSMCLKWLFNVCMKQIPLTIMLCTPVNGTATQKCLYKVYSVSHWALRWICTLFMMSVNVFYLVACCCFTDMLHEPFGIYQYEFSVWISRVCTCHNALELQIQWPDPERSLNNFSKNQHLSICY